MEKGAHVPFHPTLADVSDQTKRAFSAVAAQAIANKLEAKAKPMEFQAKLEAAAQLALEAVGPRRRARCCTVSACAHTFQHSLRTQFEGSHKWDRSQGFAPSSQGCCR